MSAEGVNEKSNDEQAEVGRASLAFLRALFVIVTLVVIWFIYDAIV